MVKVIVAKEKTDCEHLIGKFVDESNYDFLIEEDCDVYMPEIPGHPELTYNEERIVLKFRKNYFSEEQQRAAYAGLREAATETQNRGAAAGPRNEKLGNREWVTEYESDILDYFLDPKAMIGEDPIESLKKKHEGKADKPSTRNNVWGIQAVKKDNFVFAEWVETTRKLTEVEQIIEARRIEKRYVCSTTYANGVFSGIAGWFDRYPRIPYGRATSYTAREPEKFAMAYPFLQQLAAGFKDLLPWRYANQMGAASKIDPAFLVPGTPFTTVTVNKTFRTACHRDAGDFTEGLSNLLTLSNDGKYSGGYLIAPEYRVAVNVRPGDLLLINNHEVIHGNTPIVCEEGSERVSLVVYLREKMLELGSKDYEDCRYEFVESRRLNKEHPSQKYEDGTQRHLWNGVSPDMWNSDEWYEYLEAKLGHGVVMKYHPESEKANSLEGFF
tara:strand:+ start:5675 stop:6997 length:1323 start_codon:yes stop_codon:yes gene_type:complete